MMTELVRPAQLSGAGSSTDLETNLPILTIGNNRSAGDAQTVIIAQDFNQDVMGDIRGGFDKFVETGQVWALLIGLVLGYLICSITK